MFGVDIFILMRASSKMTFYKAGQAYPFIVAFTESERCLIIL